VNDETESNLSLPPTPEYCIVHAVWKKNQNNHINKYSQEVLIQHERKGQENPE
jgi:hypothetical protein